MSIAIYSSELLMICEGNMLVRENFIDNKMAWKCVQGSTWNASPINKWICRYIVVFPYFQLVFITLFIFNLYDLFFWIELHCSAGILLRWNTPLNWDVSPHINRLYGGMIFLHVSSFCQAVPPGHDCYLV